MSFPRYPKYKPSGVEWLGDVPEAWEVKRLKYAAAISMGQSPSSDDCNTDGNGLPFLQGNADFGDNFPTARSFCPVAAKVAQPGDILFSVRAPVGAINTADQEYGIGRGLCAITADESIIPRFLRYMLDVVKSELFSVATGSTYEAVSTQQVGNAAFLVPPLAEQTAIAEFLDRETGKIDELVAEQRRLMELLKEKRQAVISHAVTQGLNPHAPMKPSGIEWLGDVPAGWTCRLKMISLASAARNSFVNGPFGSDLLTSELTHEGVPVVYIRDLKAGGYQRVSAVFVTNEKAAELAFCNVLPGDVLVSKVGDPPGMAVTYPVSEPPGIVTQDVIRLRVDPNVVSAQYVTYWLNSMVGRTAIDSISVESTRTRIGLGDLKQVRLCLPPVKEQLQICAFLDGETAKFDTLAAEAQRAIDLLQERRTALISAAVTGQIDVRNPSPKL